MKNWHYTLIEISLMIALVITCTILGFVIGQNYERIDLGLLNYAQIESFNNANKTNCIGLNLTMSAYCLIERLRPFYNYSVKSDINRSIEDILIYGGDCYDYTRLYINWSQELKFRNEKIVIFANETGHTFAIMHDESGYCKLDQLTNPSCFIYGK